MKFVKAFLLLAAVAAVCANAQSIFVPGNGGSVQTTITSLTPSGACTTPNLLQFNYTTGHTWACVGTPPAALAWTDVSSSGGGGTASTYVASVNQSTGAFTCNFSPVNGSVPTCLISNNPGNTSYPNPMVASFSNLPAATIAAPVLLHFITDTYGTDGVTWPSTGSPKVYCPGIDQWFLCGPQSYNMWSFQVPLRWAGSGQGHGAYHFTMMYNGIDLYLQGDSGSFQTVQAAHVNANVMAVCTIDPTAGFCGSGGSLNLLFNSFMSLGQNSYITTGTASNQDTAGQLTLSGGTASYTFNNTGKTSAPICVATDTTAAAAVKIAVSTTALTLTGTGTDVIDYVCIFRN